MSNRIPKLGFLALTEADSIDELLGSLAEFGWKNGNTFEVVFPPPTKDLHELKTRMQTLIASEVDVIVAQTKPAVLIAMQATNTIPIVMGAYNGDPVVEGVVASLDRPGGNVTGSYYNVTAGAAGRVSVLADLLPSMGHIGIVLVPDSDASLRLFEELRGAALEQNLDVFPMPVSSGKDVDHVFELAKSIGVQGVVTVTAAEMFAVRKEVADAQNKYSLPTVMGSIGFPELGGLAKYGPEVPALWVKMTSMIDAILTKRVAPAELPLITVDGFQLDVNLDSARRLNVSIPGSILERAVRIISLDPK